MTGMRHLAHSPRLVGSLSAAAILLAPALEGSALAQEEGAQGGEQAPPPPQQPLPQNVRVSPQGEVTVTRTPSQGVEVHAQTGAGTVHAYGCSRVSADPRTANAPPPSPPSPSPCAAPYPYAYPSPYPPPAYYPPPQTQYAPPAYYVPAPPLAPDARPKKPVYPPDPARKAALIASSLVFGIGTAAAGTAYLVSLAPGVANMGRHSPSKPALVAMGAFMTVTPSVPRYVVGKVGLGLVFTAIRGASFTAGTLIDWDDKSYVLPATLAFVVPLTLGIVDLATTPRRDIKKPEPEDEPTESASFRLHGIAPTVAVDHTGAMVPAISAVGSF